LLLITLLIFLKVKIKFALEQAMKFQKGSRGYSSILSLTSGLDGDELLTSRPLPSGKRPGTHFIGGWVGPRSGLHGWGKSRPHRDSIPAQSSQ
jgi:hypothetical protein